MTESLKGRERIARMTEAFGELMTNYRAADAVAHAGDHQMALLIWAPRNTMGDKDELRILLKREDREVLLDILYKRHGKLMSELVALGVPTVMADFPKV